MTEPSSNPHAAKKKTSKKRASSRKAAKKAAAVKSKGKTRRKAAKKAAPKSKQDRIRDQARTLFEGLPDQKQSPKVLDVGELMQRDLVTERIAREAGQQLNLPPVPEAWKRMVPHKAPQAVGPAGPPRTEPPPAAPATTDAEHAEAASALAAAAAEALAAPRPPAAPAAKPAPAESAGAESTQPAEAAAPPPERNDMAAKTQTKPAPSRPEAAPAPIRPAALPPKAEADLDREADALPAEERGTLKSTLDKLLAAVDSLRRQVQYSRFSMATLLGVCFQFVAACLLILLVILVIGGTSFEIVGKMGLIAILVQLMALTFMLMHDRK